MNGIESAMENMVSMETNEFQEFLREQLFNSGGPALIASANTCVMYSSGHGPSIAEVQGLVGALRSQLEGHDFATQLTSLLLIALSGHLEEEKADMNYRDLCAMTREGVAENLPLGMRPSGPGPMYG